MSCRSLHLVETSLCWSLLLRRQNKVDIHITDLPQAIDDEWDYRADFEGFHIGIKLKVHELFTKFCASGVQTDGESGHFILRLGYKYGTPRNFDGPVVADEVFRQSPHDVDAWISENIMKQAVPLIALDSDDEHHPIKVNKASEYKYERLTLGAVSSSPAFYDNYTSQGYFPSRGILELCSGDSGMTPGRRPNQPYMEKEYNLSEGQRLSTGKIIPRDHRMEESSPHLFEGFFFTIPQCTGSLTDQHNTFRREINRRISAAFCNGTGNNLFGDLSAATAYMNLRKNETDTSPYWVVPAVEYSNIQYGRDAFWIASMLEPQWDTSCLAVELAKADRFAEYPLFTLLWAFRSLKRGQSVDKAGLRNCLKVVESKMKDGWYFAYDEKDGRQDFQFWGDIIAFEKSDVVTYNQGLLAAVLSMAKILGLSGSPETDPDRAAANYRSLFNPEVGFFPISRIKKEILSVDVFTGDLIHQAYTGRPLLDRFTVESHYRMMLRVSKTRWGFKTVCLADGSYLPADLYDAQGYTAQINKEENMPDGTYYRGGSYFLYDCLFLLNACLYQIPGALEELVQRIRLDFSIGGTTFECINTKTGKPWKPNMGWNGGIYALIKHFIGDGRLPKDLLERINAIEI